MNRITGCILTTIVLLHVPTALASEPPVKRLPPNAIRVPLTRQASDYTCGVAALQCVLGYWGEEQREDHLSELLQPEKLHGTRYRSIEKYARDHGYSVEVSKNMIIDDLMHLLDKRPPVICLIQS